MSEQSKQALSCFLSGGMMLDMGLKKRRREIRKVKNKG
jgi:hypothetical protein